MNDSFRMTLLLDFYGTLLTKKQCEIIDLHYNNDYSLSEISDLFNISRQAVHDSIKRGRSILEENEEKLQLLNKYQNRMLTVDEANKIIKKALNSNNDSQTKEYLNELKNIINNINE